MNKIAKELYYSVLPYLSDKGTPIETITKYYHYNMELIKQNRNQILTFFESHFNIHLGTFYVDEFLCEKSGKRWTNLDNFDELEIFEIVIGLGIAVGLIRDSMADRLISVKNMGRYIMYLHKEEFSFDNKIFIKNYLDLLRDYCLHLYEFNVDTATYEYMRVLTNDNISIEESKEAIKDKIISWIKSSGIPVNDNDIKLITTLMRNNYDKFINCVVTAFDANDGAAALLITLRTDPEFRAMEQIDNLISKYTESELDDLENHKRIFFDKIKLTSDVIKKIK